MSDDPAPPAVGMIDLIGGSVVEQAVYVAAKFSIADVLDIAFGAALLDAHDVTVALVFDGEDAVDAVPKDHLVREGKDVEPGAVNEVAITAWREPYAP